MLTMVTGFWVTQIIRAAAIFNFAEHLAAGTNTPDAIAEAETADPDATRRLMRTCASLGLMVSDDGEHFVGTSLLNTLLKDVPNSLRSFEYLSRRLYPDRLDDDDGAHQFVVGDVIAEPLRACMNLAAA
jgi:Dimerisation domain